VKDRALVWLAVAGWVALAIPPALYAALTLVLSFGHYRTAALNPSGGLGVLTAVVMLAAIGGGAFKYWRKDPQQAWSLLALSWAPLLMTLLWGLFGA
jgi:hypothetical protein